MIFNTDKKSFWCTRIKDTKEDIKEVFTLIIGLIRSQLKGDYLHKMRLETNWHLIVGGKSFWKSWISGKRKLFLKKFCFWAFSNLEKEKETWGQKCATRTTFGKKWWRKKEIMLQACKHSFPASHEFPQNFLAGNISIFDHSLSHPRPVCMTLTTLWNFSDPPQSMTSWLKPFGDQNFVFTVLMTKTHKLCNKLF